MKVVIIGGVAGGATAAARIRRLNENAEIIVFEKTGYVSFANCGLPYHVSDVIKDKNKLILHTPTSFLERFNIIAKVNHEVIDIDPINKYVTVKNLKNDDVFIEKYDKLILSPGAKPLIPPFFKYSDKTFTLKTLEDTFRIKDYIKYNNVKSAAVIGGGYIGVEMVENLKRLDLDVSLIELNSQVLTSLDEDMVSFVHSYMIAKGINLYLSVEVTNMEVNNNEVLTTLNNGITLNTDIVILTAGISPNTELAKKINLELGLKNSIIVDKKMQTSVEDIYAVGDAVEIKNYITGENTLISLAGPANKQGRIAADNICNVDSEYDGSIGTSILKLFDMSIASTGINEKICKKDNYKYEKIILSPLAHAGYYPDAKVLTLKLIYEKETLRILGSQIVGFEGVDKRIDVISTAIRGGIKADKLKELDLAYAPPYSLAKDPINLAGYIVDNIEKGIIKQVHYEHIIKTDIINTDIINTDNSVILLDTRTEAEYNYEKADGFINIPLDNLRNRISELDKSKKIYVMCQSGLRSYLACRILIQNGFDAYNFSGGYRLYGSIHKNRQMAMHQYNCGKDK